MSQCDYLEEIKLLDLSSKTHWGHLQQLKIYAKFFTSLSISLISSLFVRIEHLSGIAQNLLNVIISQLLNSSLFVSKYTLDSIGADQKIRQILHIVVDNVNKLLAYPQITFRCSKL